MEKFSYRSLLRFAPWTVTMIAIALLVFRSDTSAQRPVTVNAGRYQLFTATHNVIVDGKATDNGPAIFKIDTETGATWKYVANNDAKFEGWVPLPVSVKRQ